MKGAGVIFINAIKAFLADDGWSIASNIAMSTLTSLFPFLIFLTAVAGFFGSGNLADEATRLIFDTWPPIVAAPIAREVRNVLTTQRGGLLTIGALLALYFSSSAIGAIRTGLNRAYAFEETRPWWRLQVESIAYTLFAVVSVLALALLVVLGPLIWSVVISVAPALAPLEALVTFARLGLASMLLVVALFIAHRRLPAKRPSLIEVAPGIVVTMACGVGFGEVFGAYLGQFSRNYVSTYAGLASVMIALVFLYAIAAIFVFGGELNAAIIRARNGEALQRHA